jgi:hypothetical protein
MDAPLALSPPLEMFHGVGQIDGVDIDAGLGQRLSKKLTGRTDERLAGDVFDVAWLFTDEHDAGADGAFAEHRLRATLPEIALPAVPRSPPGSGER